MTHRFDVWGAVLSLLYPGWGQLSQRRHSLGWVQFCWATLASFGFYLAPAFGSSRIPFVVELALVATWSIVDALVRSKSIRDVLPNTT